MHHDGVDLIDISNYEVLHGSNSLSLKYKRLKPTGCEGKGFRNLHIVEKTPLTVF